MSNQKQNLGSNTATVSEDGTLENSNDKKTKKRLHCEQTDNQTN